MDVEEHHADQHNDITHAGRHKGFDRSRLGGLLLIPEADQQVATQPHDFPENKEGNQRVGNDQAQHPRREEADVGHKAAIARILTLQIRLWVSFGLEVRRESHVTTGIDEDHQQQER